MTDDELKELANQLRKPSGIKGQEVATSMYQTNLSMIGHAINKLNLSDNQRVLEIGFGSGKHIPEIFDYATNLQYFGLEISELMLQEAKKYLKNRGRASQADLLLYDGQKIPSQIRDLDRIFTVNTIYFWEKPIEFIVKLYDLLRVGGKLSVTFGLKKYMEKLPFTQYGFVLYSEEDFEQLAAHTLCDAIDKYIQLEKVPSKIDGKLIERAFVTYVLVKNS